jgi:hypothetical protein
VRGGRDVKRQTARVIASSPSSVASASRAAREVGKTLGKRRPMQLSHVPCESRPRACSLAARSAVQWPHLPPPLRPSLLCPQARLPSSRQKQLADCSACPCDRARPARLRDVAHGEVDFWSATDAVSARSKTARVAGRWIDVTRAVPSRLAVLCELAWPLGSAPAYRMRELRFYLGGVNAHVHGCL